MKATIDELWNSFTEKPVTFCKKMILATFAWLDSIMIANNSK